MRNRVIRSLQREFPTYSPKVIFDVGANIGQSVVDFATAYPDARIHAFEPVAESYDRLVEAVRPYPLVTTVPRALGRAPSEAQMRAVGTSTGNRIVSPSDRERPDVQRVQIDQGDLYCSDNGIEEIDFLKIDAEGYDLEVVAGFSRMIADNRIGFVQVECSMSPHNKLHVQFQRFTDFFSTLGYGLYNIFDISRRMPGIGTSPEVAFCNAVFIRSIGSRVQTQP